MPIHTISNALQAVAIAQLTIDSGETREFKVRVPDKSIKNYIQLPTGLDKHAAMKHDYQVQEFVVQGTSQDNQVTYVNALVGWFECFKRVIGVHKKKHASHTVQAQNVKPRRRGMYTFLYGGRVNVNTFYDYKDQSQ